MKTLKYTLLFALSALAIFAQTKRPYQLPAATIPGPTDIIPIDSLANGSRSLPAGYYITAKSWSALGATTGSTTAAWGTKNTVTLTGNLTLTSFTGTEAANSWCFVEGIFNGTYSITFPAAYRNGQTNSTTTTLTPPAGRHTFKFESLDGAGTFLLTDTVPGALDLAGTGTVQNILPKANGGTGTATPGIVAGTNITVTGTWPNQTINSTGGGGGSVAIGTINLWATSDIATPLAAGWLACDGTNGTLTLADVSGGARYIVMGGGNVAAPTFSPVAGSYSSTQTVTISSATSGATIKYTTDGTTTPTRSAGLTYSAPLTIAATTTLKAMAFKNLYVDSSVTSGVFTITSAYLMSDDMEYASGSAAATAGWVITTGTPTWAYATSPAPLLGSFSLKLSSGDETYFPFTATADVWMFAEVNFSSLASRQYVLSFKDSTGATVLGVTVEVDGTFRLTHGSTLATGGSAGSIVTGTSYFFWAHYVTGTGSNGAAEMYYSTNQTKPGSPTLSLTTGSATTNASRFAAYNAAGTTVVDKVRVSATSIGSSPP